MIELLTVFFCVTVLVGVPTLLVVMAIYLCLEDLNARRRRRELKWLRGEDDE